MRGHKGFDEDDEFEDFREERVEPKRDTQLRPGDFFRGMKVVDVGHGVIRVLDGGKISSINIK